MARAILHRRDGQGPGADGDGVVVVLGRPSVAEADDMVDEAAAVLFGAWPEARFLPALRRSNVHGALDMGLAPGILPGRVGLDEARAWYTAAWGAVPEERGLDTAGMLSAAAGPETQQRELRLACIAGQ